jgi:hypothetical protein
MKTFSIDHQKFTYETQKDLRKIVDGLNLNTDSNAPKPRRLHRKRVPVVMEQVVKDVDKTNEAPTINNPEQTINLSDLYTQHTNDDSATKTIKIELNLDKIHYAYDHTSPELKGFMKMLLGSELFEDKYFKVGDSFCYAGKTYKIIQLAATVITMLDTETFVNFCKSHTVKNVNRITERELQLMLGIYYNQFKFLQA